MAIIADDGGKWACEACVKGHRVSACVHKERPLQYINRKGRPVTQCQHCRYGRKNRSAHVKCICAELGIKRDASRDRSVGSVDSNRCRCMYGAPCTCSLKREALDSEDLPRFATHNNLTHRRAYSHNKPIMANRRSDSHVQSVRGGQHPPLHRTNHAHRETGFPYNVGRFSRSTGNFEFPQRSLESNPPTSSPVYGQQSQDMSTILPPRQNNFVRSEVNSPAPPANVSPHADNWNNTLGSNRTFLPSRNPARHSMNDFSQLSNNWDYMNSPYLPPTSAGVDPFAFQMQQHLGGIQSLNAYNNHSHNPSEQDLQRSSFMSIEQPGLSHSPSASASEAGESVANFGDHPYSNNTIPQYNQKESDQFLPVQEYESPNMDFYSQAHSATSTPFAYSVSDSGLAGPADFLNGPGPATSQEFKQQSSSPINFSIDPPSQDYSTADIPSTTSEHLPSGQPMQSTMNQSGMAMPAGQGYGSQPEYRVSPAPPAAAGNSPYA